MATRGQLALLDSLRTAKGRRRTGLFLVEGLRLCEELAGSTLETEIVVAAEDRIGRPRWNALLERFRHRGVTVALAPESRIQRISETVHSQGIIAAARWRECSVGEIALSDGARIVALDRVSDPGNVGTIIRTAAWFGVTAVMLGEGCADLLNPKTVRATMGGLFHLPVLRNLVLSVEAKAIKERWGCSVFVAGTGGEPAWWRWIGPRRSLLVLGSEAHGVADEIRALAESELAIPRLGWGESLNVAIAAGVFLSALASGGRRPTAR